MNNNIKIPISIGYIAFGIAHLVIYVVSNLSVIHMALFGVVYLIAGIGMWFGKSGSYWLAISLGVITSFIGIITLYSSLNLFGFSSNNFIFLFNIALIIYIVVAFLLLIFLILNKRTIF